LKNLGTEIRTFRTLKEITEYIGSQADNCKASVEDYGQWLGSLLRTCEEDHKDEEWYQKSIALQKTLRGQSKQPQEKSPKKKSGGKGKQAESSCWVKSGDAWVSSAEQAQVDVLFDAIEKLGSKIQELDRFKTTIQQLERIGLGKETNYITYIEEDVPKKIVIISKKQTSEGGFKFATELSVPGIYLEPTHAIAEEFEPRG
jgi:prefoldin subunit 5